MSGRKSFRELSGSLGPERRARVEANKDALRKEMRLAELRAARQLTQETISKLLDVGQPSVAKLEKRTDMYVSTLRSYITATGGELEIIAHYPDGDVRIQNFADLDKV